MRVHFEFEVPEVTNPSLVKKDGIEDRSKEINITNTLFNQGFESPCFVGK